MKAFVVMAKEIVDNIRDRQTVFYALLFGPVLLPLLLGGSLIASFKSVSIDFDEVIEVAVHNGDKAPQLIAYLYSRNIDVVEAPDNYRNGIEIGSQSVVLEINDSFGEAMRAGRPAPITLHFDSAEKSSAKVKRRVESELRRYAFTLNTLRLQHRGIDPSVFNSLDIIDNDVSDEGQTGQLLASLLPFLFIMSMVMGGFYLAIDITAGERERQSLEPLLSLPLSRPAVVFGKYGATLAFVALSGALTAVSIYLLFRLFPVDLLDGQISFDGPTVTRAFLLATPLLFFVSALLVTVSAITRSTKEAQTYLGLMMVLPMTPFFALQYLNLQPSLLTSAIPMLSQYQLLEIAVLGGKLLTGHVLISILSTLTATAGLLWMSCRLYSREKLLD